MRFCGLSVTKTKEIFGFSEYLNRYGRCGADAPDLTRKMSEFDDWRFIVPWSRESIVILCCPEDRDCKKASCLQGRALCRDCRVPLCRECDASLREKQGSSMPPAALGNDMMIFYAPKELYTMQVTALEMICASVCLTSMICFTMETRYRKESPFDSEVHMARHRMGARGNATSLPLPWQELLVELQRQEAEESQAAAPNLPWTGEELSNFVSVLLKTSEEDDPKAIARFIHQARVRRDVVVKLIEDAKARGHRAYRHVNLDRVRGKAKKLPADGVPPEIVRLLPHDDDLDKIQVQKAATPVAGRSDLDGAAKCLSESRPNAVVLEKSTDDAADINAQRIASVRQFAQRLSKSEGSRDTKVTAKTTPAAQASKRLKTGCPAVVDTQDTADDAPSAPS